MSKKKSRLQSRTKKSQREKAKYRTRVTPNVQGTANESQIDIPRGVDNQAGESDLIDKGGFDEQADGSIPITPGGVDANTGGPDLMDRHGGVSDQAGGSVTNIPVGDSAEGLNRSQKVGKSDTPGFDFSEVSATWQQTQSKCFVDFANANAKTEMSI